MIIRGRSCQVSDVDNDLQRNSISVRARFACCSGKESPKRNKSQAIKLFGIKVVIPPVSPFAG